MWVALTHDSFEYLPVEKTRVVDNDEDVVFL